jgi:hypothetical protein
MLYPITIPLVLGMVGAGGSTLESGSSGFSMSNDPAVEPIPLLLIKIGLARQPEERFWGPPRRARGCPLLEVKRTSERHCAIASDFQRSIQPLSIFYFFSVKWLRTGWLLLRRWGGIFSVLS